MKIEREFETGGDSAARGGRSFTGGHCSFSIGQRRPRSKEITRMNWGREVDPCKGLDYKTATRQRDALKRATLPRDSWRRGPVPAQAFPLIFPHVLRLLAPMNDP